ncbi:MAG: ChaN family lipoprotein [Bacteroidales bacterium]|nr:ChaN family lipoprotein [Bacteroidales bacterium]MCF8345371.1 ChaN family lipoprotein [Bacteroidales bacterium]MCF8351119.1 ChaN family lipoprotein [Bacteroidales bacterium]MCF8374819.1 ChaN family lipoprotein [Bacteroidales bacterium]MCF8399777.1 ChaN family lipoprotein [Bacteroidales bacterium]
MKIKTILFSILIFSTFAFSPNKQAYQLFKANGKKAKYKQLIRDARKADIVFFGELHNNPIGHWMQLEISKSLFEEKGTDLIMGAEMFESDNQLLIDEYLNGLITEKSFEKEARLWPNYKTDYKPLLEFAHENQLDFIATNIPRRYASVVHKNGFKGLEDLSLQAKSYIAPLPVVYDSTLPGYKAMLEMMGGMGGHVNTNLPKAQAIKDATMAHFILEHFEKGKLFIHFNGAYHSKNFEGIVWYLKEAHPQLNILTISSEEQKELDKLKEEYEETADYILVIPEDMTKTY